MPVLAKLYISMFSTQIDMNVYMVAATNKTSDVARRRITPDTNSLSCAGLAYGLADGAGQRR